MIYVFVLLGIAVAMGVGLRWFLTRQPGEMAVTAEEGKKIEPPEE